MVENKQDDGLNRLLIEIAGSLAQYMGECWPWTQADAADARKAIDEIVVRQQDCIAALVEFLSNRQPIVEFGTYPTEFTDLHYVSLDFLLDQLIKNEQAVLAFAEQTATSYASDAEAVDLLKQIIAVEREHVATLEKLAKSRTAGSPA